MKNLHFARFLQNDIVIISDISGCVKIKLSHFAKIPQNHQKTNELRSWYANSVVRLFKNIGIVRLIAGDGKESH